MIIKKKSTFQSKQRKEGYFEITLKNPSLAMTRLISTFQRIWRYWKNRFFGHKSSFFMVTIGHNSLNVNIGRSAEITLKIFFWNIFAKILTVRVKGGFLRLLLKISKNMNVSRRMRLYLDHFENYIFCTLSVKIIFGYNLLKINNST